MEEGETHNLWKATGTQLPPDHLKVLVNRVGGNHQGNCYFLHALAVGQPPHDLDLPLR